MTNAHPIGILDSGFGGLSVARAVRATLPHENILYTADCGHAPWGDRTDAFIDARVDAQVAFLLEHSIKALVIACNTATAVSAARLRARYDFPIVGIEPAVLPAARQTTSGVIGVMATTKTLSSDKYRHLRAQVPTDIRVLDCPCPGLMDCVEKGAFCAPETQALLDTYVSPLIKAGADSLVLGCTHYPFLMPAIARTAGPGVRLIDPAPAVAQQLRRRLDAAGLLNDTNAPGQASFYTSDARPEREAILRLLWPGHPSLHPMSV